MADHERLTVRAATDADDVDALNEGNPTWVSVEFIRGIFAAAPEVPRALLIAELGGRAVGSANAFAAQAAADRRGIAGVYVPPARRGLGAGTALWREVLTVCTPEHVPGVLLQADAADGASLAVALAHGLTLGAVHRESELSLAEVTGPAPPPPADIRIEPLVHDADEAMWRRIAGLHNVLELDTPDAGAGIEPTPYEVLRSVLVEPWQVMLGWHGDEVVAYSSVMVRDQVARRLNTLLTGVTRDFRGRRLSTAIKAAHARLLRDAGWATIVTQNMEGNAPILASNARLGFRISRSIQDLHHDFGAASADGIGPGS